ncbi:efflux RND transporter periplasmic adaptor subunit [Novosphingobium sp. RD2P27]|uniref:Efflux RND transporter periplasmic adaptor subunit n=1 Tax=Novosphingobium kalidii TaxID=3230299 RepID=A0ABV2CWL3_9SPHN
MNSPLKIKVPQYEAVDADASRPRRLRRRNWIIGSIAVVLLAGLAWRGLSSGPVEAGPPPPAVVQTAQPLVREVTEWDDFVGRFAASRTVEVRPRVSGAVSQVLFKDGDYVRKGQPLFLIDPRPYRAALAEAQAEVAAARSNFALAQSDYSRVAGLTGDEAMAASEVDARRARMRAASAALAAAQARVQARALDVEFATVRAPISGRVSDRRVDAGNLVSGEGGAGATLLTTINAVDPIYFTFDASEGLFLKTQRERVAKGQPVEVQVRLQDEAQYRWNGKLDFTDNGLDPRSGTIRLRAVLPNPDGFLTPGMFGNMRLANAGKVPAMLVPAEAIQSDQARKIVLIVGQDGVVTAKPVQVGPLVSGLRVIRSGLAPTDRVVISNYQAAVAGSKVEAKPGRILPAQASATPNAGPTIPTAAQATLN